ncbi:MAG TPA: hypothetical protein VFI33_11835 [Puia sp.]|nr:hypothetical protein [Puia sp.]
MIIGYEITGYDNGSFMTGSCKKLDDLPFLPKCNECGYRTDYRYTNKDFKLKRENLDFSSTYDGVTIVSLKFKEFCNRYGYKNLVFNELPKTPNFFQYYIEGSFLQYNARLFENQCNSCKQYESVIGPAIQIDLFREPLEDGFYQSNLWFASGNEKSPVMIISPVTKENMVKEKFRNICFDKIEK